MNKKKRMRIELWFLLLVLNREPGRVGKHDLRHTAVLGDFAADTDALSRETLALALTEPAAVSSPNQYRKDLIRVRSVEI